MFGGNRSFYLILFWTIVRLQRTHNKIFHENNKKKKYMVELQLFRKKSKHIVNEKKFCAWPPHCRIWLTESHSYPCYHKHNVHTRYSSSNPRQRPCGNLLEKISSLAQDPQLVLSFFCSLQLESCNKSEENGGSYHNLVYNRRHNYLPTRISGIIFFTKRAITTLSKILMR